MKCVSFILLHTNQTEYNIYITTTISLSIGFTFKKIIKRIEELRNQITLQSKDLPLSHDRTPATTSDSTIDSAHNTYSPPLPPPEINDTYVFNDRNEESLDQQIPPREDSVQDIKIDKVELEREILELEIRIKELEIKKKTLEIKLCKLNKM
ncbi:MAG TPA: hypothetical protein VJ697_02925 [Nitrososphaeraceae archaeon]|nr:hypothetical protein [Nitrososphaeraceae archaeon]